MRRTLLRTHHFGFVVRDIRQAAASFEQLFSVGPLTPIVHDLHQQVNVAFLPVGEDIQLELIEPAAVGSPVDRFLAAGGGLNHICFHVPDIHAEINRLRESGMALVSGPTPAAAFGGRQIAFLYGRECRLVELVEGKG